MDLETTWWIIIHKPGPRYQVDRTDLHPYTWPAGDEPGDDQLNAARTLVGFPPNDDWVDDDSGWQLLLTKGRPHPTLMARATVGTFSDLGQADSAAVAAHAETRRQGYADRRAKFAKAALAELDDATLSTVLADPDIAKRTGKGKP